MNKILKHFFVYFFVITALVVCFGAHEARADITSGLVGHWEMDDDGDLQADDSSGNNNHGALTNMELTDWVDNSSGPKGEDFGTALDFDGVNEHVQVGANDDLSNTSMTVAAWVYIPGSIQSGWRTILEHDRGGNNWYGLWKSSSGNRFHFRSNSASGYDFNSTIFPNTWYHVAGTYDASTGVWDAYLNGSPDRQVAGVSSPIEHNGNFRIGRNNSSGEAINAIIDDVRVYNRALSPEEVQELYDYVPVPFCPDGLCVSLSANPSSGQVPLDVDLTADVVGSETGDIHYYFWCDCDSISADPGTVQAQCGGPNANINPGTNPQIASCTYTTSGTKTAKVVVERGTSQAENRTNVNVYSFSIGGLWGHYLTDSNEEFDFYSSGYTEGFIENVNFNNFDAILYDRVVDEGGSHKSNDVWVVWSGSYCVSTPGTYNFRVYAKGDTHFAFSLNGIWHWLAGYDSSGTIDKNKSIDLNAGCNPIRLDFWVYDGMADSEIYLQWKKPGDSSYEIVPASVLRPKDWSDDIIAIPDISEPKAPINYIITGAGAKDSGGSVDIRVDLENPDGIPFALSDILDDNIWMFAGYTTQTTNHFVTNNNDPSHTRYPITGVQRFVQSGGRLDDIIQAKLPPAVINDYGTGQLDLLFELENGSFTGDGIALIIPYIDSGVSYNARLYIRTTGSGSFHRTSPVYLFPTNFEEGLDTSDIRPFFVITDGETRIEMPNRYRPNALYYLSGDIGAGEMPPGEFDIIKNMGATRLVPENGGVPNSTSYSRWYPSFGREGPQLDVISQNYVPNLANPLSGQGRLNTLSIGPNDDWIAFQVYGERFTGDGMDAIAASSAWVEGESAGMFGGGLVSIEPVEEVPLPEVPTGVNASSALCETADLTWNDGLYEDYYVIQKDDGFGFATITPNIIPGYPERIPQNTTSYRDEPVGAVENKYRIRACNDFDICSGWSSEVSVTPESCAPPADFSLDSLSDIEVNVTGNAGDLATSTATTITVIPDSGPPPFEDDVVLDINYGFAPAGSVGNFDDIPLLPGNPEPVIVEADYSTGKQFTVTIPDDTLPGVYSIIVTGDSGTYIRGVTVTLYVNSINPEWKEF